MYKQVILVRKDLKLPKGKLSVQVAHASLQAALKSERKVMVKWLGEGAKKVVLKVNDEKELKKYRDLAEKNRLKTALIIDAGKTVVKKGTTTCLGIGPDEEKRVDKVSGKLKMV